MSFVKIAKEFLMAVKGELDPHTTQKGQVKVRNFLQKKNKEMLSKKKQLKQSNPVKFLECL